MISEPHGEVEFFLDVLVLRKHRCFVYVGKIYYYNEVSCEVTREHPQSLILCKKVGTTDMSLAPYTEDSVAFVRDRHNILLKNKKIKIIDLFISENTEFCFVWSENMSPSSHSHI